MSAANTIASIDERISAKEAKLRDLRKEKLALLQAELAALTQAQRSRRRQKHA